MSVVGKDIAHESGLSHATGESLFLDDIRLAGELFAAIVPCPVARGRLKSLDVAAARAVPGVAAVLVAADVGKHNLFGPVVKDEALIVSDEAAFLGQPLALIAARDAAALDAARKAINAQVEPLSPIFSIDEAIAANSYFGKPRHMARGDIDAGFAEADETIEGALEIGGQEHFYLESQIAIAVPGERDAMTVHSSTQHPSEVQAMVAEVLDVSFNHVNCICVRMGGGFGGKETQAAQPAMYAALLAKATKRPVRFAYDKDDDMRFTGKRHPFKTWYRAGFKRDGRLTAFDLKLFANGGCSTDLSFAVLERAMLHSDNAYYLPNVRFEGRVCKTNLPSNTAFRGFGGPQGVAGIEHVLQAIAVKFKMDALDVRRANVYGETERNVTPYGQHVTLSNTADSSPKTVWTQIRQREATWRALESGNVAASASGSGGGAEVVHPSLEREEGMKEQDTLTHAGWRAAVPAADPVLSVSAERHGVTPSKESNGFAHGNTLPHLIDLLRSECNYDVRRREIGVFNAKSKTLLRGLALSAVKFGISFTRRTLNQANALVNIYTDGSVLVTTGATEMGQGVHTRVRQVVADALGVKYERVRIGATQTDKNNNTSPTAASSGTDLNGAAAMDACGRLRGRLAEVAATMLADPSLALAAEPSSIEFADGTVFDRRSPDRATTFEAVVARAYEQRVSLGERGHYATPGVDFNRDTGKGTPFLYFTNGVACAEVSIDRFTGELKNERVDLIMDVGVPLNPGIDRGQVIGGFVQGMGWCTTEELVYKSDGTLLSHSPTTYKIPNVSDLPPIFNVRFLDNPYNVVSIHRSKAVGEPPLLLGLSVWLAAKDAISYVSPDGATALALPATGERILMAMETKVVNVGGVGASPARLRDASVLAGGDRKT
jgi:xanthine dehydrogenase large subunit